MHRPLFSPSDALCLLVSVSWHYFTTNSRNALREALTRRAGILSGFIFFCIPDFKNDTAVAFDPEPLYILLSPRG